MHSSLKQLFLSSNYITNFPFVCTNLLSLCSSLESLSVAECPVTSIPPPSAISDLPPNLHSLNLSSTSLDSMEEVENLSKFPALTEVRLLGSTFLSKFRNGESRSMVIATLPNIKILNGGSEITEQEREESERLYIRSYLDNPEEERPGRVSQLIDIHGTLDPLVKIDLSPEVFFKVKVIFKLKEQEMIISVRQRVRHFKRKLSTMFYVPAVDIRLWYYDQEISQVVGPEEMKWPEKGLYTYNIRNGDYFMMEERMNKRTQKEKLPKKTSQTTSQRKTIKRSDSVGSSTGSGGSDTESCPPNSNGETEHSKCF